jgi:hypothetical protein
MLHKKAETKRWSQASGPQWKGPQWKAPRASHRPLPRARVSALTVKEADRAENAPGKMVRQILAIGNFVRHFPLRARFGDLSRAPLSLLRFQVTGGDVECDWLARPADAWDADLRSSVTASNVSTQALKDAIEVRSLIFRLLPNVESASIRVYRAALGGSQELVITGNVNKEQHAPSSVRSLAMRAKLFGLRFWLDEGVLEPLECEEYAVNS